MAGSTGVGKSDVAAQICAENRGMVISADSVQVYRGVQIGANKPTLAEREATPHLLIDVVDASTPNYNAAEWRRDCLYCIQEFRNERVVDTTQEQETLLNESTNGMSTVSTTETIQEDGTAVEESSLTAQLQHQIRELRLQLDNKNDSVGNDKILPVVVGGTMMYLQWLVHGRPDALKPTETAVAQAQDILSSFDDYQQAVAHVASIDESVKDRVEALGDNDWYRLRRTLEVLLTQQQQQRQQQQQTNKSLGKTNDNIANNKTNSANSTAALFSGEREGALSSFGYDVRCFFLCPDERMQHTEVVDRRCEDMILRGLLQETTDLAVSNQLPDMAKRAIGYRQVLDYLLRPDAKDNDTEAFEAFLNDFTTATRRYAKKQMQWFRKDDNFAFVPVSLSATKPDRVRQAAAVVQELCRMPRKEYEKALGPSSVSAATKEQNAAQGKQMKFYQFQRYALKPGSPEFAQALAQADECSRRLRGAGVTLDDGKDSTKEQIQVVEKAGDGMLSTDSKRPRVD